VAGGALPDWHQGNEQIALAKAAHDLLAAPGPDQGPWSDEDTRCHHFTPRVRWEIRGEAQLKGVLSDVCSPLCACADILSDLITWGPGPVIGLTNALSR